MSDQHHAILTVHTPTGPTDACWEHAQRIVRVLAFLGTHANTTPAPDGAQCANCVNEARAARKALEAKQ